MIRQNWDSYVANLKTTSSDADYVDDDVACIRISTKWDEIFQEWIDDEKTCCLNHHSSDTRILYITFALWIQQSVLLEIQIQ